MMNTHVEESTVVSTALTYGVVIFATLLAAFICLYGTESQFDVKRYLAVVAIILPLFICLYSWNPKPVNQQKIKGCDNCPDGCAHNDCILLKMPAPIYMKRIDGVYLSANETFSRIAGMTIEEIIGKTDKDIFPPEIADLFKWQDQQVIEQNKVIEFEETVPLGDKLHTFITIKFPVHDNNGIVTAVAGHCTDISKRKLAMQALKDSEKKYRTTMNSTMTAMFIIQNNKYKYGNKTFFKMLGYSTEEIIDKLSPFDVTAKKQHSIIEKKITALMAGKTITPFEVTILRKDQSHLHGLVTGVMISYDEEPAIVGSLIDITNQKLMEEELKQSEHLDAIGVLAAGIAHDYNNILSAILGNIQLARHILKDSDEVDSILSDAQLAAKKASTLSTQLLTFASGGNPVKESVSMAEIIRENATFLLHGSQNLKSDIDSNLWLTEIDVSQMNQVVQNLIINAQQAMSKEDTIEISCKNAVVSAKQSDETKDPLDHATVGLTLGNYIKIVVKNTGTTIPPEIISKIFEPYFSTKTRGHGLGLATTYSIVKRHGGKISVDSIRDEYTAFTVYIPAISSSSPINCTDLTSEATTST